MKSVWRPTAALTVIICPAARLKAKNQAEQSRGAAGRKKRHNDAEQAADNGGATLPAGGPVHGQLAVLLGSALLPVTCN